ncbi:4Fe-4S dicluster domain-containing protein [Eggerthella lenta]|uniref:4Fe-4S dicluster domain-containing protein n=1 Tax=Eggerthella lenta TaxID=84112 RepID=UPI0018AC75AC|nr:4Fe-4S binding protein [Eggerthella lenta]MDB1757472.1 4Fe-4S binding protein [Eggerthella lenta]MDB1764697.1 4Fe-4S binding protein [Eggerthella lenta]
MADAPDNMPEQADGPSADTEGRPNQIVVLRDYCTRVRGADCSRCALACPHDAIGFAEDGRPTIDTDACTRCGICLGICDAFSSSRVTMIDVHARIRRIALRGEDVVLTCKENVFPGLEPAANVVVLPCLACLSPEFWTLVLTENIPVRIAADLAYCADCERAGEMGEMLYAHAVETAEKWSGAKVGYLDEIPEKENLVRDLANPEGVDRRSAFTNLVSDVGDIASGKRRLRNSDVLQQFYERKERARARARLNLVDGVQFNDFVPQGRTKHVMWPKRQLLLEAIDRNPDIAARVPVVLSETDRSRCTNSLDCVAACPTGARFPSPENGELSFDARYCIGCGLCVDACPQQAIELVEATAAVFLPDEDENPEPPTD